ncbi:ATP-binding cassette domain-containing protein [Streptomyces sp. NPDC020845]|uniref:ATP-binding cassette domain-containing protein n=1 Tax=Streptomyces sp. NPDC020845 TaxID=3365096 RepID=UPI00378C3564
MHSTSRTDPKCRNRTEEFKVAESVPGKKGGRIGARGARPGPYAEGIRFLRERRRVLWRLAAWSVLESGQTFLSGYALARALDDGFLPEERGVGLAWLGLAALAVALGAYGTGRVYRAMAALVEPLRDALVRRVVTHAVGGAGGGRTDDGGAGGGATAVSRLTHQVEIARDTFAGLVMVSRSFVFVAAGALVGLFSLAPVLLLVVLPPLILGLALFLATLRPMARRQEAFLEADENIAQTLGAVASGLRDITAAGAEERVGADAGDRIDAEYRAARALARWGVVRVIAIGVGGRLPVVLLLVAAPWLLGRGVTTGVLVGALAYLQQSLLPALQSLMQALGTGGSRLAVVVGRLAGTAPDGDELGPESASGVAAPDGTAARPASPAVELRAVTFAYGDRAAPVVEGLDLDVPAGGHLAVVGPSGIGKSTLAGLIAGLLEPRSGEVRVCGEPAREPVRGTGAVRAAALRVLIPQEAYVFSGTLADNLRYLCPETGTGARTDAELAAAAEAVGLDALLSRIGGPYADVDPGALSAGERQLIALARAYLSPAPVVLLDEATCHLDPAAEARAERAFARRPGTTLIVIAHRVSSARRAERVLVMDGRQTVCGRHAELLERSPLYRDLAGSWRDWGDLGSSGSPGGSGHLLGAGASDPALAPRDADGVHAVARPGLPGDGGHVVAYRPVGQMQAVGDLGDRGAFGGQ